MIPAVNDTERLRERARLITYAIAAVLLDEIDARGLKDGWVIAQSGVAARSYSDYMGGKVPKVPATQWAAIAYALGLRMSEVSDRAEDLLDAMRDDEWDLMARIGGPAALVIFRELGKRHRGGGVQDPSARARADQDDGALVRSAAV